MHRATWIPWWLCLVLHGALVTAELGAQNRFFFRFPFFLNAILLLLSLATLLIPGSIASSPKRPLGRGTVFALLAVILLGIGFRTVRFNDYLRADSNVVEESQTGSIASRSLADGALDPDFPLTDLLAETGLMAGGASMNAIRVPFVVYSVAGILFFFLAAGGVLRSNAVAIGVAAVFAANAFLATSGRVAMETFAPVSTTAMALAACFHARNKSTPFAWGLAGVCVGLLWEEYFSYRMVALALAAFGVAVLSQGPPASPLTSDHSFWRTSNLRANRVLLAVFFAMIVATISPVLVANLQRPPPGGLIEGINRYFPTMVEEATTLTGPNLVRSEAAKLWQSLKYLVSAERSDVLSDRTGFFEPLGGILVLGAFTWCLFTCRRRPARLLIVLIPFAAVSLSTLLTPSIYRYRTLCVVPFLILALGILADDLIARFRQKWVAVCLSALVAALIVAEATRLFRDGLLNQSVKTGFSDPVLQLVFEIRELQQQYPDAIILVIDEAHLLARAKNDYEFLYARPRTRLLASLDDSTKAGPFVAYGPTIIKAIIENPRLVVSKRYPSLAQRGEIIVGTLSASPALSP